MELHQSQDDVIIEEGSGTDTDSPTASPSASQTFVARVFGTSPPPEAVALNPHLAFGRGSRLLSRQRAVAPSKDAELAPDSYAGCPSFGRGSRSRSFDPVDATSNVSRSSSSLTNTTSSGTPRSISSGSHFESDVTEVLAVKDNAHTPYKSDRVAPSSSSSSFSSSDRHFSGQNSESPSRVGIAYSPPVFGRGSRPIPDVPALAASAVRINSCPRSVAIGDHPLQPFGRGFLVFPDNGGTTPGSHFIDRSRLWKTASAAKAPRNDGGGRRKMVRKGEDKVDGGDEANSQFSTIPSFNDFHRLKKGRGLGRIAVSPVRPIAYDEATESDADENDESAEREDASGSPMRCYEKVRWLLECSENESTVFVGGRGARRDSDARLDAATKLPDRVERQPKISNFSSLAPVIIAELKRGVGATDKDILESDLDRVKEVVDGLIADAFREDKESSRLALDLTEFIEPMMKRHADYDRDHSLFRKLMEEVMGYYCIKVYAPSPGSKSSTFIAEVVSSLLTTILPRLEGDLMTSVNGFRAFSLATRCVARGDRKQQFFLLLRQIILCTVECAKSDVVNMMVRHAVEVLTECLPTQSSICYFYSNDDKSAFRDSSEKEILSHVLPLARVSIPGSIDNYFKMMKESVLDVSVGEPTRRRYLELLLENHQANN